MTRVNRILGLDPGLSVTGYGFVVNEQCLDYGMVRTDNAYPLGERIAKIISNLRKLILRHKPKVCVIESLFFRQQSARSVIYSAHLRGALFYLLFKLNIPVIEVTPAKVKKVLTGNGRASKAQINYMVRKLYKLDGKVNEHAADALAVAYCYEAMQKLNSIYRLRK
ncbi:MAG: crossover junction endodeoxyribonuclease RuvC [candidate division WOR-3 bacterium]